MPWCHTCETEYGEGITRCPDCGGPLSPEMPPARMKKARPVWKKDSTEDTPWPKTADGQPERAVFLATVSDVGVDAELVISMLRAFGVPVVRQFEHGGQLGKVILGFSGYGEDLYVPESMLDLARELLAPQQDDQA